ncbi:hypothetical protein CFIO01_07733 [Colletotrichum fioriniae PJ7]|uniref:Uncharacterized protein n=1 Tax=Colletotrichum fioriniae PJ7 TaxID=1445577 RepID=A0A010S0J0_9PEZI|nr:hypothetical protein CFIO01_07733 [Colletotrichum fioriniae PJ7]
MSEHYSQERVDLVAILAASQRIEFERCLAEIKGRNGGNSYDTLEVLQRLAIEAEAASSILSSLQTENIGGAYNTIYRMVVQQTLLIKTQLLEVAGEMGKPFLPTPMSNPRLPQQSNNHQQQQQQEKDEGEHQKPPSPLPRPPRPPKIKLQFNQLPSSRRLSDTTPTLDAMDQSNAPEKQRSPTREIKGFPPRITRNWRKPNKSSRRRLLQVPAGSGRKDNEPTGPRGTNQGGSVRRRDQTSRGEQEERIEPANVEKWTSDLKFETESKGEGESKMEVEMGDGTEAGDQGEAGEKRSRKRSADNDLSPTTIKKSRSELRGGQGGSPGRIKRFISSLNPFRRGRTKSKKSRDAEPTTAVPSTEDLPRPAVECYIFAEALNPRTSFGTGKEEKRALHYRDAIEELIQLVEDAPHAITSTDPLMREYHTKQFKEIQAVLRKIPSIAISKKIIDEKLLAIRKEETAIRKGYIRHLRGVKGKEARTERRQQLVRETQVLHRQLRACNELNDKIFAFGAESAAIFADWIVEMKKRVEGELEFGERAMMVPYLGEVQQHDQEVYYV